MKKKELTEKLMLEFQNQVPDEYDKILLKCQNCQKERKNIMKKEKKKSSWGLPLTILATSLVICISGGLFYNYNLNIKVDSIIDIDVNPSIELQVNKKEKIVNYKALNNDAKEILNDMDLKDVDIDIALNAIIGSMVTKGYLDDLANSILISVDNNDAKKAESMRQKLVEKIDKILNTDKIQGSVLSQTINNTEEKELTEAEKMAKKYDISLGKAKLILDVLKQNSLLKEEDLVKLTINEINILTQDKKNNLTTVEKQGDASTKAYISKDKAKDIALNHAKITKTTKMEIEFDADDGTLVYDVEFETSTYEYDYEINAITGDIIKSSKEKNDDVISQNNSNNTSNNTSNFISESKAKDIALNHAKVNNPDYINIELDQEDREYNVEFVYNNIEYEYEINAITGKIIKSSKEKNDNVISQTNSNNDSNFISKSKAKDIALNHAKVNNPDYINIELDQEDKEYNVEFEYNNIEYEYEINAITGKIIDYDIENKD